MDELERANIVDEVLCRINEMDEDDRKQNTALNRRILSETSAYFVAMKEAYEKFHPSDGTGLLYCDWAHVWQAYYQIRKLIPWIVGVRYSNDKNWDAFYRENPGAERRKTRSTVANPMLEEDAELATKIGKELIDILFKYLEPGAWDEAEAAKNRPEKPQRSPFKTVKRY